MKPLFFLEVLDNLEEITRLRVAARTEHAHEALRRPFCPATQLLESDRRIDVVAKYRLPRVEISGEKAFDAFPQQLFPVFRGPTRRRACTVSLNSRVRGISLLLRLALLVVGPSVMRGRNVTVLPLLRSPAEQNHDSVAVFAEIDPISGPEIDAVLEHASTDALDVREVPYLQCRSAVVTFAAAAASSLRNQVANGLDPARSRYRESTTSYGNINVTIEGKAQRGR